jgi:hypothetical protein
MAATPPLTMTKNVVDLNEANTSFRPPKGSRHPLRPTAARLIQDARIANNYHTFRIEIDKVSK